MLGGSFEASCIIVTAKKLSAAGQHFLTLNSTREQVLTCTENRAQPRMYLLEKEHGNCILMFRKHCSRFQARARETT